MPFLAIFGKKDAGRPLKSPRSRSSFSRDLEAASSTSVNDDDDYVIPPLPSLTAGGYDSSRSSSQGSHSRQSLPPPERSTLRLVTSPPSPSTLPPELQLPAIKHYPLDDLRNSALFLTTNQPSSSATSLPSQAHSARTLQSSPFKRAPPLPRNATMPLVPPQSPTKRSSLFAWISGGAKKKSSSDVLSIKSSKSSPADPSSLRLSSFHRNSPSEHVPPVPSLPSKTRPIAPEPKAKPSAKPNSGFQVTSRPRPISKEQSPPPAASSTVTAGAFRQAARRSTTNLALPATANLSNSSLPGVADIPRARSPARAATPPSSFKENRVLHHNGELTSTQARRSSEELAPIRRSTDVPDPRYFRQLAGGTVPSPKSQKRPVARDASSSDSDSDDRLDRQSTTTVTRRSAVRQSQHSRHLRSESGHSVRSIQRPRSYARTESGHSAPPSSFNEGSDPSSIYSRPRASQSATTLSVAGKSSIAGGSKRSEPQSETSEEDTSDSSSSDDAPLSALMTKRRSDGTIIHGKQSPNRSVQAKMQSQRPLVDLSAKSTFATADTKARGGAPLRRDPSVRSVRSEEDLRGSQARTGAEMSSATPRDGATAKSSALKRPTNHSRRSSADVTPISNGAPLNPLRSGKQSHTFAPPQLHRNSPASSSNGGDSSSGFLPLTPRDGSDLSDTRMDVVMADRRRPAQQKRASVTFAVAADKTVPSENETGEQRRRERRRSEARNAIELGNVVNGPAPVLSNDEQDPLLQPRFSMPPQLQPNPGDLWNLWNASQGGLHMGQMPGYVSASSSAADINFLAAHQHAMAIAKQTYQLAVAQQAMAAAAEEWERGSAVSGMSGGGSMIGWGGVFPNPTRSMYAGSVAGSSTWGTSSLYGENIGPMSSRTMQNSMLHSQQIPFPPSYFPSSASEGPQGGVKPRQRTRTAPSSQGNVHAVSQSSVPPSSWKKSRA